MDFFELLERRKSVRKYEDKPVEADLIQKIMDAVETAPSSRGLRPWYFKVITDKKTIEQMSEAKKLGSAFLKNAPLAVVVGADESVSDVWIEDAAIASTYISLAAEALGLGNCWIQIRNRTNKSGLQAEDYLKELLAIPQNTRVLSIVAIGYPCVD